MSAWYESQIAKDLFPIMGARAVRGIETNFFFIKNIYW